MWGGRARGKSVAEIRESQRDGDQGAFSWGLISLQPKWCGGGGAESCSLCGLDVSWWTQRRWVDEIRIDCVSVTIPVTFRLSLMECGISFQIVWLQEEASKPYLPCGLGEKQRGTLTRVRLKVYTRTRRSWKHHPIDKIKMSCIKIVLPRKTSKIIQDLLARSCWDCCYFRLEILLPAHSSKILTTSLQGWLKKIWIFLWHIIPSMTHGATKRSDFYTDSKPWTENSSGAMGAHLLRDSVLGPSSSLLNNLHRNTDYI
jgi:hypothetical protein